jgi:GH15 family glucan-1,4-alpha-glucosidase
MPVYLSTAVLGNQQTLLTVGHSGELMAWFYPHKDHAQHIHQCIPCVYLGHGGEGHLHWAFGDEFTRDQTYLGDTNVLETVLEGLGLRITFTDVMPDDAPVLLRRIQVQNTSLHRRNGGFYHFGDWNMGGIRQGNGVVYSRGSGLLIQNHREATLVVGGSALQGWQCGKAGTEWANNAKYALERGQLHCQDLEIGDVNWAFGFYAELEPGESVEKVAVFAMGQTQDDAVNHYRQVAEAGFDALLESRRAADEKWLAPGVAALQATGVTLPEDLEKHYKRSLLCLPLLCGEEGAAVAAPEFDPEFISCGGYGYTWPRDGAEYISGLLDAGYPEFSTKFFDWSARHQASDGLWHQRYFLNGGLAPNWCLPPDMLQVDQVGAVLWGYGKWLRATSAVTAPMDTQTGVAAAVEQLEGEGLPTKVRDTAAVKITKAHKEMIRKAADYLLSRQDPKTGVHMNAFDTWETFVGSFTYSNAAIYAAFMTAARVLKKRAYAEAARKMKEGVLTHFVREADGYKYLVRGFKADGSPDEIVDSASLGAIEPFELLDLYDDAELELALGTIRAVTERLEVDWEGGRAIRRFEGDGYVGGVPACVNTLWMARCCLHVAERLRAIGRAEEADELTERAQGYLQVVLRRATPTGLLPELMQGPTGQRWWAAPHGWAMASFVTGVLKLAHQQAAAK